MMPLSTIVVLLGVVCSVVSDPAPFSASNGGDFSIMTVTDNGELIVAEQNIIYRLSANLSVLDNVVTSGTVRGLSLTNGGQYVMVCVNTDRSCSGYNVTDFTNTLSGVMLSGNAPSEDDPVAMFPGEAEGDVYVGTVALGSPISYPMMLGQYNITGGLIMTDRTRDYIIQTSDLNERIFHTGFVIDDFAYYIVGDGGNDIRILRVCIDQSSQTFRALYEVELVCSGSVAFVDASVVRDYPYPGNDTLVLVVQPPLSVSSGTSGVCTYSLNAINTAMNNSQSNCAAMTEVERVVWTGSTLSDTVLLGLCAEEAIQVCNLLFQTGFDVVALSGGSLTSSPIVNEPLTQFTSSVIVQVEGELLMFIGTSDGRLLKYIFNDINTVMLYLIDRTITTSRIISLQWSLGSDYVYGLTSEQVIPILVEDCQSLRDCTSCAASMDPLCGWCSIEKKCSRRSECSNNTETRRWIQEEEMCIVNFAISPNTLPVEEAGFQFAISADLIPPPLTDENFYCVFGDLGSSVVEGNLNSTVDFTNLTCNYSFTVDQFSNESTDTIVVDFSLRSNIGNINFITITDGLSFFNCSTHTNCRSCLSSNNLCGWCLYDKKCTSSSDQCRVVTDWINTRDNTSALCPLILDSNATNGYEQPVVVSRNLSIVGNNLPPPNSNYTYQCVIQYNGLQSILQAEYTGPDGLECILVANDFSGVDYVSNGSVIIRWTGPDVVYDLETEVDRLNVILYDCSALAGGCSSCLSVSNTLMLDCGWCNSLTSCVIMESCSDGSTFTTTSSTCPLPQITMVNPNSGPYQGGTDVTISGTDLGVVVDDIINITIGGAPCMINTDSYLPGERFRCVTTSNMSTTSDVNVEIPINRSGSVEVAMLPNGFRYAEIIIQGFTPVKIPSSANILISINGSNFNVGNTSLARIEIADTPCVIQYNSSTFVQCIAGARLRRGTGQVAFILDNAIALSEEDFTYTDDPQVFSLVNDQIIESGGIDLIFNGRDLNVVETRMVVEITNTTTNITTDYTVDCISDSENDRTLSCPVPTIPTDINYTAIRAGLDNGTLALAYSLVAASVPGLADLHLENALQFTLVDDPEINMFVDVLNYQAGSNEPITITGERITAVRSAEVTVGIEVGTMSSTCNITNYVETSIQCIPPRSITGNRATVMVYFGDNLNFRVGEIRYQQTEEDDNTLTQIVIPAAVGGAVLILALLFLIVLCVVIRRFRKKEKESERLFADLQLQLEEMESGLADECKTAFTELQTDLELVYHPSEGTLPFLDFRSFAMRFLFPREVNHAILQPLEVPKGMDKDDMVRNLEAFKKLLMNKKFLHTMVKTLEGNPQKFGIPDRCNVASYLMVAFQTDLDYATEILILLLGDLIQRSLSTRQNPKLLLRRTESIAEKMLANWLCFLLYPYISDCCGESLYVLVKAIKARLEKGPIDVITGEAKYSLSDERLLRHAIDPKPVDGLALSPTGEEIPIKMWECDTVTQAKEKILDAIYKNNPVSSRPSITEIDLELATSTELGVPLRDFDASNESDGEFKKINTLGHFHLHVMSAEATNNAKKLPPKFRLVTRREDRSPIATKADMVGTIILNPSAMSSATLSITDDDKIYHLVKPEDNNNEQTGAGGGRQKLIREVFLPRLLATKRILQPFVDDLFKVVFTVPRGKPLPKAIKYLFDFLDWQAAQNGITDPEVLHTWKTNSLPLRFWVNVIKNPEFVFDINKSATVDSCLSTVASAYIDACSTKEYPYSKDAPAGKLLYISEVKSYKTQIQQYYQSIQSLPKIGDHEMQTYLRENQQMYFVSESAVYELFKYSQQYSQQIIENLEGDGLRSLAANFEKLLDDFQ
ncbi:plexin-A2-like isoform X2 [Dysidea avara]|uniref:plexin-A2-like isoform X2 n=1 Tax=Dysidea avara TaxID=196820 RepID=UPI0033205C75